jgi:hypothetical protein
MGVPTPHHHFRVLTAMSPLRMLVDGLDAAGAPPVESVAAALANKLRRRILWVGDTPTASQSWDLAGPRGPHRLRRRSDRFIVFLNHEATAVPENTNGKIDCDDTHHVWDGSALIISAPACAREVRQYAARARRDRGSYIQRKGQS